MPDDLARAAIADAGPLIHLDELGVLNILDAFTEVRVPSVVAGEAERHRAGWKGRAPAAGRIEDPAPDRVRALMQSGELDPGEAAALALWESRRDAVLLGDDMPARRYAERVGCTVAGTRGLLLRAARTGRLPRATAMQLVAGLSTRTALHLRPSLLADAMGSLEDE